LNVVGESVLFDEADGRGADRLRKGQDSELELAKRLQDLAGFQLGPSALKKLHEGDDSEGPIWRGVDGAGCLFAAAGCPDENVGVEDHFDFRERARFSKLV
jgi:hypothetical protein